jgi:uncharacterized protein (DUF1778 family)
MDFAVDAALQRAREFIHNNGGVHLETPRIRGVISD